MGCHHHINLVWKILSLLFLAISSSTHQRFMAEGRANLKPAGFSKVTLEETTKMVLRAQIGSRPPRCERRCSWCGHCEAIQVPTNPQAQFGHRSSSSTSVTNIAYASRDDNSNYKPMSWKCKCGKFIFNP